MEKKVEHEKIVRAALLDLSLQIVEFVREHGSASLMGAIKLSDSSGNTPKLHFRDLTARTHLEQYDDGRGVWYKLMRVGCDVALWCGPFSKPTRLQPAVVKASAQ